MKRILISSFIISCYILLVLFILIEILLINADPKIIILLLLITVALGAVNIINAIVTALKNKNETLTSSWHNKTMLVFKLIMIPFFVLNFIFWYTATSITFLFGGFLLIPIGIVFTYIILLSSSTHVISEMYVYYKNRKITFPFFILHSLLQLLFVVDVIDYIYVHRTLNKIYNNEQYGLSR